MKLKDFWKITRFLILMYSVYKTISGQNLALGKNVIQSTTYDNEGMYNYDAILANDGDRSQDISACYYSCCAHTQHDKIGWWVVDLGDVYEISNVIIFGRADCCQDRLSKFYIEAIKPHHPCYENGLGDWSNFDQGEVSGCFYQEWGTSFLKAQCKPGTVGQFLIIRLTEQKALALCEVEVYGKICSTENFNSDEDDKKIKNIKCVEIGSYYEGLSLVKYQSRSVVECLVACTQRSDCFAANYKTTGKECDLMAKDPDEPSQSLVTDITWGVYFNPS